MQWFYGRITNVYRKYIKTFSKCKFLQSMQLSSKMNKWMIFFVNSVKCFFDSGFMKSNGVILDQMVDYLGTTHSLVGWAFSIQFGLSLMSAPLPNALLNILSYRQVATIGGILVGLGYVYCGLCVQSLWQLFLSFIVSGIGFGFMELPCYLALHDSFPERFGTIFCASSLFNFVGIAVLPPIMQKFNDLFGFRDSLVLFGAMSWNLVPCGISLGSQAASGEKRTQRCDETRYDEVADTLKQETESKQTSQRLRGGWTSFMQEYLHFCSSLIQHRNFAIVTVVEFVVFYLYSSWTIFLVSLGTSAGFTMEESVLLSTVGGIGGFVGKVIAVLLFHFEKINAYTCALLPLVVSGISFLASAFVKSIYGLAFFAFLSGGSIGYMNSGLIGLIPTVVCKRHFQQAAALACLADGIAAQVGGLLSGVVHDAYGSTRYVFGFNACLCLLSLPFVLAWACSDQTVTECEEV